ncbi:MAG: CoA synthetase, partial [Dehalococcoidia bacterium]
VDFVSAPGTSPENVYRPGGPDSLITGMAAFAFDRARRRFRLASVHPGHDLAEVRENTGFEFDHDASVATTPQPGAETLALLRGEVARDLADSYPDFAARVFGLAHA